MQKKSLFDHVNHFASWLFRKQYKLWL